MRCVYVFAVASQPKRWMKQLSSRVHDRFARTHVNDCSPLGQVRGTHTRKFVIARIDYYHAILKWNEKKNETKMAFIMSLVLRALAIFFRCCFRPLISDRTSHMHVFILWPHLVNLIYQLSLQNEWRELIVYEFAFHLRVQNERSHNRHVTRGI